MRKFAKYAVATMASIAVFAGAVNLVSAKVRVRVWHPWGGVTGAGLTQVAQQYEKINPNVDIEMVSVPNQIETNEKFFTSMAAGTPPEVILVDGTQVSQWAAKDVLTPLDSLARRDGIKAGDFFTPSYKQCVFKGKLYSMPFESDPNFPLAYNKTVFAECGLPGAPTSFEQMEEYAKKADRTDGTNWTRAGMSPMNVPWWGNMLFTYGWMFGADFYKEDKDIYQLNHPKAIEGMDWMLGFYNKRGPKFAGAANQGYPGLVKGKVAMMPVLSDFTRYLAADKTGKSFQWGWGFLHGPGESPSAWIGGWTMAMPKNAKNQKEAWNFIKWICWDKVGTESSWKNVGWMPSTKTSPVYTSKHSDDVAVYVETMKIASHARPVSLATPLVFGVLETLGPKMLVGKKSASQALKEANDTVQKELTRLMARVRVK